MPMLSLTLVKEVKSYHTLVLLITGGGFGGYGLNSTELYLPSIGTSCSLPNLPDIRLGHTVDNDILCGGSQTLDTCLQWNPDTGNWQQSSVKLNYERYDHVSWSPKSGTGIYLMGGDSYPKTTTLIKPDWTQEPDFQLKYERM